MPLPYVIALLARLEHARRATGSAQAVLSACRLMTNSNFVACCTGKSAGLAHFQDLVRVEQRRADRAAADRSSAPSRTCGRPSSTLLGLVEFSRRQPVFAGRTSDDARSFGEKAATGGSHPRAQLLLLLRFEMRSLDLQASRSSVDLLQFSASVPGRQA